MFKDPVRHRGVLGGDFYEVSISFDFLNVVEFNPVVVFFNFVFDCVCVM